MVELARNGIQVRVFGPYWGRAPDVHPNLQTTDIFLAGEEYGRAVAATKINLCFLRKENRDLQTTRTMEIPACGAFMLAERTDEHLALFREGIEADFFSSNEELIRKAKYYLQHDDERVRIAAAGRARCLSSGYDNHSRLGWMIERVLEQTSGTVEKLR
jgi:spore maturation protein CgeB